MQMYLVTAEARESALNLSPDQMVQIVEKMVVPGMEMLAQKKYDEKKIKINGGSLVGMLLLP